MPVDEGPDIFEPSVYRHLGHFRYRRKGCPVIKHLDDLAITALVQLQLGQGEIRPVSFEIVSFVPRRLQLNSQSLVG
jgi:hypothetical protein